MKNLKLGWVLLTATLLLGACAPAARPSAAQNATARAEAARGRFTVKNGEVWQMTAFKPGNQESQKFPLELFGDPEIDSGYLVADAEAGRFDATLIFDPRDDSLFVGIRLSNTDDPDIVYCQFENAAAGKAMYSGESLFGKASDLDKNLPDERFADCKLERGK